MNPFLLETDSVSSAASSLSSISQETSNLSSEVSSWDSSCEDGFDFASPKGVIASNLSAYAIKVKNTSDVMDAAVSSHTQLQNSLKFQDPTQAQSSTNSASGGVTGSYPSTGFSSSTPVGAAMAEGAMSSPESSYYDDLSDLDDETRQMVEEETSVKEPVEEEEETQKRVDEETEEVEEKEVVLKEAIQKVGYAYIDEKEELSKESEAIFENEEFTYDENGYAKLGDRYVISCDESIGKVGDVIRFTQEDGTEIECIVGFNTKSSTYENTIHFLVDPERADSIIEIEELENLLKDNKEIENLGNYEELEEASIKVEPEESLTEVSPTETTEGSEVGENTAVDSVSEEQGEIIKEDPTIEESIENSEEIKNTDTSKEGV